MPRLSPDPARDEQLALARSQVLEELSALLGAITQLDASALLEFAAGRESERDFQGAVRAAREAAKNPDAVPAPAKRWTFRDVADAWLSGEIHRRHPFTLKEKGVGSTEQSRAILKAFDAALGGKPVSEITKDDVMAAKAAIPEGLSQSTYGRYARHIRIVMGLAVAPLELIEVSPVPPKFVPAYGHRRALGFLYPDEDAQLLSAPDHLVPYGYRFYYGFLARVGCRPTEGRLLVFGDFDLRRGILSIDKTKTKTPRSFVLPQDVTAEVLSERERRGAGDADRVFPDVLYDHLADQFREHLRLAGVDRRELHLSTGERRPLRAHDLRGSFVTIALANGANEDWVMRRTGHQTSAMLAKYRRQIDYARDAELGWWQPLDRCLHRQAAPPAGVARGVAHRQKIQLEIPGLPSSPWTWSTASSVVPEPKTPEVSEAASSNKPEQTHGWHAPHQVVAHEQAATMSASEDTTEAALLRIEQALALALEVAMAREQWQLAQSIVNELGERRRGRTSPAVSSIADARKKRDGEGK